MTAYPCTLDQLPFSALHFKPLPIQRLPVNTLACVFLALEEGLTCHSINTESQSPPEAAQF